VEDLFFALEIEIYGSVCDSRFASYVCDFGIEIAVVRKDSNSGSEDCSAFIAYGSAD
jgi:hypothetical protein